jgi:hypothetical protein
MTNLQDKTDGDKKLTERQRRCLPFLISCKNVTEGCKSAGITTECFYTWLEQPSFKAELNKLRNAAVREGLQQLKDAVTQASQKLIELLDSEVEETRRKAACNILEYSMKIEELQDVEGRLESIERIILERRTYGYERGTT